MRVRHFAAIATFALACGRVSTGAPPGSAEPGPVSGSDAGLPAVADGGGPDEGPESFADCSGIEPPVPGPAVHIHLDAIDPYAEGCEIGDVDGSGKIAISCIGASGGGRIFLADAEEAEILGPFGELANGIAGQASGFIGRAFLAGGSSTVTFGIDESGRTTFKNPDGPARQGDVDVNNLQSGAVLPVFEAIDSETARIKSFDASGNLRWARTLPGAVDNFIRLGVDRAGNVLALWNAPLPVPLAAHDTMGQWFDPAGNPGPIFVAFSGLKFVVRMVERVGSGLFVEGAASSDGGAHFTRVWLGQLDALSTMLAPPPAWLAARPAVAMHMAHGGTAYVLLPPFGAPSSSCEQTIEVISAAGHRCGAATFPIGGGGCMTDQIIVGYDGTVVQKLPDYRCPTSIHSCNFEFQAWKGFFR
jgi:hypothetical protein